MVETDDPRPPWLRLESRRHDLFDLWVRLESSVVLISETGR